ncbi:hypothetical protein, partial [Bifidobacterium pseudocatenulatum]|uniref:hypothetical protein n=1 Tax=Bifidobacterium pseudocatenulatum TaxID=28026 RepID=UPI0034A490AC
MSDSAETDNYAPKNSARLSESPESDTLGTQKPMNRGGFMNLIAAAIIGIAIIVLLIAVCKVHPF